MRIKIITLFLFLFLISFTSAVLPTCSDTNEIDINDIPCVGLTIPINCTGNITILNTTDASINFTISTFLFTTDIYNFTINLSRGSYELIDCQDNTATIIIGLFEQGYGINMFTIIFPSILLTIISLFISGRMFKSFGEEDEEQGERLRESNEEDSFIPKSRLMPFIFMLFAFVPMVFMVGFVNIHLEEYLSTLNITTFYGMFYVLFSIIFYFVFLVSFLVWASSFIEKRRVMKDLDDIQ